MLGVKQTADLKSTMKNRRIEIFFRNRYISIGNNVNMKNKINKFIDKQTSKVNSSRKTVLPSVPPSVQLLNQHRSALIRNESKKKIITDL